MTLDDIENKEFFGTYDKLVLKNDKIKNKDSLD